MGGLKPPLQRRDLRQRMDQFAGDYGGCGAAFEGAAIEGRVAGLAGGVLDVVGPGAVQRKNSEVGGSACYELAFFAQDSRWAGGEQFDHAHEAEFPGVDQLFERKGDGGFEAEDAEGGFVELDVLEGGLVGRVIGGNGVDGAVGETLEECFAVFARG